MPGTDRILVENLELLHPLVAEAIRRHSLEVEVLECDPSLADTAAFCEHYKFSPDASCNAIVAAAKGEPVKYACCVVLASCKLDVNKVVSRLMGVRKCSFATSEQTVESTAMQIGGVTPVGVSDMPVYVDRAVMSSEKVVVGGGNRSTKLLIAPGELAKLPNVQIIDGLGVPR